MAGSLPDPLGINKKLFGSSDPVPPPPMMSSVEAPKPPDVVAAADRTAAEREARDKQSRKRGRASTVVTGPEGVGYTPLATRTLVGT